jgi:hypothetical protein
MARDTGNIGQKTQKKANKAKHTTQKTKRMSNTYRTKNRGKLFDENQNPVDMHISIMCINIIQNNMRQAQPV